MAATFPMSLCIYHTTSHMWSPQTHMFHRYTLYANNTHTLTQAYIRTFMYTACSHYTALARPIVHSSIHSFKRLLCIWMRAAHSLCSYSFYFAFMIIFSVDHILLSCVHATKSVVFALKIFRFCNKNQTIGTFLLIFLLVSNFTRRKIHLVHIVMNQINSNWFIHTILQRQIIDYKAKFFRNWFAPVVYIWCSTISAHFNFALIFIHYTFFFRIPSSVCVIHFAQNESHWNVKYEIRSFMVLSVAYVPNFM